MKNRILYTGLLVFAIMFVVSCAKTDDDNEPPVIHYIKLSQRDTINVAPDDTIFVNVTDTPPDTLILKHYVNFEGHFSDNEKLSTYMISLDTIASNTGVAGDTIFTIKVRRSSTSGMNDIVDTHRNILIPDSLSYTTKDAGGKTITKNRPVREGKYNFEIQCADEAGNITDFKREVYLINRKTVIDNR